MGNDSEHCDFKEYKKLHKRFDKKFDGGACLDGRCYPPYGENTCSYRWQALEKARENKELYKINTNKASDSKFQIGKKATRTMIDEVLNEKGIWRKIPIFGLILDVTERPNAPEKDVAKSGTHKGKEVKRKDYTFMNFTNGAVPYGNQVHHIVACAELRDGIMKYPNIANVISIGLLEVKYNINYKDNAIILPSGKRFARMTGLPSHMGSHPEYSKKIEGEIEDVLAGYESLDSQYNDPTHKKPDPLQVKQDLLEISNDWYQKIIDYIPQNKAAKTDADVVTINQVGPVSIQSTC